MRVEISDTWQQIVVGHALVVVSVIDGPIQYVDAAGEPDNSSAIQNVTLDAALEVMQGCWMRCPIPGVTGVIDVAIEGWDGVSIQSPDGSLAFGYAMTQASYDAIPVKNANTLYVIKQV